MVEADDAGAQAYLSPDTRVIELEGPRGGRMRIEVPGATLADLVALTQVAWGPAR